MLKDPKKNKEIRDILEKQKDLLIFVADPRTDEMVMSFGGFMSVVQFPFETMDKGIIFNALRQSKFKDAIDPFMTGIEEGAGITVKDNQQLAHIIGGSIMNIGNEIENKKSELSTKKKTNGKTKKD